MSFPPPLQNNPMFQAFAQGVPPMPPFHHQLPMGGIPMPLVPPGSLPMGVTVPAGVASISAPPVRNQNTGVIAAPPMVQLTNPGLLFPPSHMNSLHPKGHHHPSSSSDAPKKSQFTIPIFVGNITERASDMLIRQVLSKCGTINHWKRVQGTNGKLQAFGFCEYSDIESSMRAIRLLHNLEIADKKLIVRVDAKSQEKLDEYRKSKNINSSGESEGKNDNDSSQNVDVIDSVTKEEDDYVKNLICEIIKGHEYELSKDVPESTKSSTKRGTGHNAPKDAKPENLDVLEIEDDKRNLIHREIDRFRDTYKKYDEEKEEEKKKRDEDRVRRRNDDTRSHSRDRDDRRSGRSRDRSDRRTHRDRRSHSLHSDSEVSDSPLVDVEEKVHKRRNEKMLRDKENSYQRRLKDWESREKRKAKDYDRDIQKELRRKEEEDIEKQKLKQFLQDYDDDKHDPKYYKGRTFNRRLSERQKENEQDVYEREQERKELESLKQKLAEEGHPDPDSEVRKRLNVDDSNEINDQIKMLMSEARNNTAFANDEDSRSSTSNMGGLSVKTFGFTGMKISAGAPTAAAAAAPQSNGASVPFPSHDVSNDNSNHSVQMPSDSKRKRLMVSDVFNSNEDDEANILNGKKRRPPPNALLEDSNTDSNLSGGSNNKQSSSQLSQEEKRRQIKTLIDKIPTSKNELFNYSIEWDHLDNTLMERRIKPWINKKISDYIGEEEKTLLEFICKKLLAKSSAQSLLDDVAMVLDEEAQVFVVKLWRLLIYEIEAKKLGLNK